MVSILTDRLLRIMSDSIPNKVITVNDKDALWVTLEVKRAIRRNRRVFDRWRGRGRPVAVEPLSKRCKLRPIISLTQQKSHTLRI